MQFFFRRFLPLSAIHRRIWKLKKAFRSNRDHFFHSAACSWHDFEEPSKIVFGRKTALSCVLRLIERRLSSSSNQPTLTIMYYPLRKIVSRCHYVGDSGIFTMWINEFDIWYRLKHWALRSIEMTILFGCGERERERWGVCAIHFSRFFLMFYLSTQSSSCVFNTRKWGFNVQSSNELP